MRKIAVSAIIGLSILTTPPALALERNECFSRDEMNKIMRDANQRIMVMGNSSSLHNDPTAASGVSGTIAISMFTSNPDGSLGYAIDGDAPISGTINKMCVSGKFTHIRLFDARKPGVPAEARRGAAFDKSLAANEKKGTRPMLQADAIGTDAEGVERIGNGLTLFANMKVHTAYAVVNYRDGSSADMYHMVDIIYTPEALDRLKAATQ